MRTWCPIALGNSVAPSPQNSLAELYQRPGFLIRRAQQIAVSLFLEETGELGITNTQYGILTVLKDRPGLDQISLAKALEIWSRRSEEHTSELQSPDHLVCRLLLEKKK